MMKTKLLLTLCLALCGGCASAPQPARSQEARTASTPTQTATPARATPESSPDASADAATFTFRVHKGLPRYTFTLSGKKGELPDRTAFERIEVRKEGDAAPIQTLEVVAAGEVPRDVPFFETVDLNFDGYTDAKLLKQPAGGTGAANARHCVWLFDPEAQRFAYSEALSELPNLEPDAERRQLKTSERDGTTRYTEARYGFAGDKLNLEEETKWTWLRGKEMFRKVVKKQQSGKMVVVSKELTKDVE